MLIDTFKSEFKNDTTVSEYGTTAGTLAPSNNPAPIKITNNLMNNVFSGEELESILGNEYKEKLITIQEIVESSLKGNSKVYLPVLEYYTEGRIYNYYRDFDGVFIRNELTGYRSKSHNSIFDISLTEQQLIIEGIY